MIQSTIRPDNTEVIDRLMYKHADSWRIRFDENGNFAIFAESFLICRSCIDEIDQTYGRRLTKISTAVVKGSDGIKLILYLVTNAITVQCN